MGMLELNPLSAFRLVQLLLRSHGGVKQSIAFLSKTQGLDLNGSPDDILRHVAAYAATHDRSFDAAALYFDVYRHPMPHHFTEVEMANIFERRMCFSTIESGETRLFNDKGKTELMPKARYALLRDDGNEDCYGRAEDGKKEPDVANCSTQNL